MKSKPNEKPASLEESTFLDKKGKKVKVNSIITTDDCWHLEKENKWVLSHSGVQKIANAAGISKNYHVEESKIEPTYKNGQEHIVRVTIKCLAGVINTIESGTNGPCHHDIENTLTVTGEANRENTSHRGKGYLRKMAEKRAYDIAVLQHVGLYMTIFSEEESETFVKKETTESDFGPSVSIMNTDIEYVKPEINLLINAKTVDELKAAWQTILKPADAKPYTPVQFDFLRKLYDKQGALLATKATR